MIRVSSGMSLSKPRGWIRRSYEPTGPPSSLPPTHLYPSPPGPLRLPPPWRYPHRCYWFFSGWSRRMYICSDSHREGWEAGFARFMQRYSQPLHNLKWCLFQGLDPTSGHGLLHRPNIQHPKSPFASRPQHLTFCHEGQMHLGEL